MVRAMRPVPNVNPCLWIIKSQLSAGEGVMKLNPISICNSCKLIQDLKMSGLVVTFLNDWHKNLPWPEGNTKLKEEVGLGI